MSDVKKRIIEYETAGEVNEDFYLLGDNGTEGTFKIPVKAVGPIESICPVYDAEAGTYDEGDYCFHDQKMYQCNTDISVPEDFDPTKWDEVTIAEIMASQQSEISTLNASLTQLEGQISTAKFGIDSGNKTSFSFTNLHNLNNTSIYKHGIVVIGAGSTQCTVYMVWINESNTNVVFTNLTSTTVRNLTGSVSGTTLTITADSTVYGGLKLIWLT